MHNKAVKNINLGQKWQVYNFDRHHHATSLEVVDRVKENTHHIGGKLEPKLLGPYSTVEVKESGDYIVTDKYLKGMK